MAISCNGQPASCLLKTFCFVCAPSSSIFEFVYSTSFVHESMLLCAITPRFWALHSCPLPSTLLRNLLVPPDPPVLEYLPYNIGHGNLV